MESAFVQSGYRVLGLHRERDIRRKGETSHENSRLGEPLSRKHPSRRTAHRSHTDALAGLKGKRVALGDEASGTLVDARIGVERRRAEYEKRDIQAHYLSPEDASTAIVIAVNDIDAYFAVAGFPAANVSRAFNRGFNAHVLALTGPGILSVIDAHKFLSRGVIPAGVYQNRYPIPTINVSALMVVSEEADPEFVYQLAKALWRPTCW